jgi:hypothetical protein
MQTPALVDHHGVTIDFFESVPNTPGLGVIRLPRCQNCFDEVHDYSFGKAYCIPAMLSSKSVPMEYVRMGAEQLARWTAAEQEEQERRERESAK